MEKKTHLKLCDEDGSLFPEKDNGFGATVNNTNALPETLRNYHYSISKQKESL
ncbi:hypothetical protein [uncultured Dysgonomonas sp.]|uniref:Uncharacterized protein n=1 Tax=uncultured Dysgonomonas sp. TaxID=206096 RepID=A0A212JCT5_9BACT|nr:hypothetical protein [uncultured Dysgonomonas sp.]SBV97218.1 hypothetical protein KL86DYS1_11852 [uncultured Dysgonomonas sp.]